VQRSELINQVINEPNYLNVAKAIVHGLTSKREA